MKGVEYWVNKWERATDSYEWRSDTERTRVLAVTGQSPEYWRRHWDALPSVIETEIRAILRSLQGRRRRELRKQINDNCRRLDQRRIDGQLRHVIASMTDKFSPALDMDELRVDDEQVTADPAEIHEHLTEWFDKAYRGGPKTGQGVHKLEAD